MVQVCICLQCRQPFVFDCPCKGQQDKGGKGGRKDGRKVKKGPTGKDAGKKGGAKASTTAPISEERGT